MSSLQVDVLAYEAPCGRCSFSLWWVFGLLPSYRPRGEEFTTTGFPEAVDMARRILAAPDGDTADVAAQLHDRPAWQRGPQLQPELLRCLRAPCRLARFREVLNRACHGGWIHAAAGRVPVLEWRAIRGRGQGVYWPYC